MIYLFTDETYRDLGKIQRFALICVGVPREAWRIHCGDAKELGRIKRKRVFEQAITLLKTVGGTAAISYADVPKLLIPPGAQDHLLEIPYLNRRNAIWGRCATMVTAPVIYSFDRQRIPTSIICFYYENKTLAPNHRDALHSFLRTGITKVRQEQLAKTIWDGACHQERT